MSRVPAKVGTYDEIFLQTIHSGAVTSYSVWSIDEEECWFKSDWTIWQWIEIVSNFSICSLIGFIFLPVMINGMAKSVS